MQYMVRDSTGKGKVDDVIKKRGMGIILIPKIPNPSKIISKSHCYPPQQLPIPQLVMASSIPFHHHHHHRSSSSSFFSCLSFGPSNNSSAPKLLNRQRLGFHFQQHSSKAPLPPPLRNIRSLGATIPKEQIPTSSTTSNWAEFGDKVSGEWDGYGADFSKDGQPIELPESVVPEAFREWEVKVFDWQTQCPTLAQAQAQTQTPQFDFSYKLIKLLPTVGCEADAATTYATLHRTINTAMAFAYQSNTGCYVAVWNNGSPKEKPFLELEYCLVHPGDRESRVRIIQEVRLVQQQQQEKDELMQLLQLERIKVFCEQWYGPFRNGDQLGGCAIRDSAFASTPALQSSQISGVWRPTRHASASFQHNLEEMNNITSTSIKELVDDEEDDDETIRSQHSRDGNSLVLLPKQLWSSSNHQPDSNNFRVGWLYEEGLAITASCTISSNANLKEIAMTCEKLQT